MRRITTVVLAATIAAGTAAIASTTESYYDKSYNLGGIRSFSFEEQERVSTDPLANNSLWGGLIRDALQGNLRAHGFEPVSDGRADVILSFSVQVAERYDIRYYDYGFPSYWGPWSGNWFWGWGPGYGDVMAYPYLESTVIVDMVDARTNRLVWRGFNKDRLDLDDVNEELPDAANDVLRRFYKDMRLGEDS
jgi:hypothetical protein